MFNLGIPEALRDQLLVDVCISRNENWSSALVELQSNSNVKFSSNFHVRQPSLRVD